MIYTKPQKFDRPLPQGISSVTSLGEPVNLVCCAANFIRRAVLACDLAGVHYYFPLRRHVNNGVQRSDPLFGIYYFTFGEVGNTIDALSGAHGIHNIQKIHDRLIMPQLITVEMFLARHPDAKCYDVIPKGTYMTVKTGAFQGQTVVVQAPRDGGKTYLVINAVNSAVEMELPEESLEPL